MRLLLRGFLARLLAILGFLLTFASNVLPLVTGSLLPAFIRLPVDVAVLVRVDIILPATSFGGTTLLSALPGHVGLRIVPAM